MSLLGREPGFTLVEMMLSVAIISLLVGLSIPVYESFVRRNDLDLTAQTLATMLRRAQTYARANNSDDIWGVEIQSSKLTLFRGSTFASRVTSADETYTIPGSITPTGLTEVKYAKLTAAPDATGTITLKSTTSETRTISINAKGMVDY